MSSRSQNMESASFSFYVGYVIVSPDKKVSKLVYFTPSIHTFGFVWLRV